MKLNLLKTLLLILTLGISFSLPAQQRYFIGSQKTYDKAPLTELMDDIEGDGNVQFFYKREWLKEIKVSGNFNGETVSTVVGNILSEYNLQLIMKGNKAVIITDIPFGLSTINVDNLGDNVVIVGETKPGQSSGAKISLSGYVTDGKNEDELIGVTIVNNITNDGVVSNKYGFYSMDLVPGLYEITFNYIGFEPTTKTVLLKGSGNLNIDLFENTTLLKEVTVVTESSDQNVSSTEISTTRLDIKAIETIPAFLGEVDIVRTLLLLPGVTTVGEGAAGYNVRGGSTDQNLLLFDDAPLFNPAHIFGFFSNFNSDVVKNVTLYKGGIPAKFGGRTASVLNVVSRDANYEKFRVRGGIGLVSSRLAMEVPIVENKSALMIGSRASYSDWLLGTVRDLDIRNSSATFYDVNSKWTTNIGKKDRVAVSGYFSNDKFKFAADTTYSWRTRNGSVKWNHLFNNSLSTELIVSTANYDYIVEGLLDPFTFEMAAGVHNNATTLDIAYIPNPQHQVNIGTSYGVYSFDPGERTSDPSTSNILPLSLESEKSIERAFYIQDNYNLTNNLSILGGVRFSSYSNLGPGYVLNYEENSVLSNETAVDTTFYNNNETIASYSGWEPRFSLKYSLDVSSSIKFSYNRLYQYIHTISNTTAVTPIDVWKSSDRYIAPQISDQIAVGYFKNYDNNNIETSVELYYKKLDNVIDYKNGAELLLQENIEQQLATGIGRAYGVEFFLKKKTGRLNGWVSYTYSRTQRKVVSEFEEETINRGEYYAADYDKPHNLSIVGNYKITRRWSINGNFTYSTGRPFTAPEAKFIIGGLQLAYFSERNQYRIPDYHRLDFSVTLEGNHKRKKILDGSWTFSLYNVYARRNAYSVFFRDEPGSPPGAYKLSVLGRVFPALTYNFSI